MAKKNKKGHFKPNKESVSTFKAIEKFIKEENESKKDKFSFQQKKVKMPYKMYMGIKNSVMKENLDTIPKSNKDNQNDLSSFISDISHTSILQQKLKGK